MSATSGALPLVGLSKVRGSGSKAFAGVSIFENIESAGVTQKARFSGAAPGRSVRSTVPILLRWYIASTLGFIKIVVVLYTTPE